MTRSLALTSMRSASTPSPWFLSSPLRHSSCSTTSLSALACSSAFSCDAGGRTDSQPALPDPVPATMPSSLFAAHRRGSLRRAADIAAHHAWRFGATARRCSATIITPGRSSALPLPSLRSGAMLLFDEQFRDDGKPQPAGAFARAAAWLVIALTALNVVFDAAGMRLRRVSGQPARLRTAQTRAVRLALTPTRLSPHQRSQPQFPNGIRQFPSRSCPPRTPRGAWPAWSAGIGR